MNYRQLGCWLLAVSLLLASAVAQTPPTTAAVSQTSSTSPSAPTFRTSTRMVTLEVVARDHHGQPVQGLTADDFQLIEQIGKHGDHPQKIAAFRAVSVTELAAQDKGKVQLPAGVYTNLVTMDKHPVPPTILLVDGLNTNFVSRAQLYVQITRILHSITSDRPACVFLLGRNLKLIQNFTTNPELLKAALQKAQTPESNQATAVDPQDDPDALSAAAESMNYFPPDALNAMKQFERESYVAQMDERVRITVDALRAIARYASGYPGRKNLLWISSAFPIAINPEFEGFAGVSNYSDQMPELANEFAESKIAIYPMDPAGLQGSSMFQGSSRVRGLGNPQTIGGQLAREGQSRYSREMTMRALAEETGGIVCVDDNDLGDCVRKAVNDGSSFYEIAYYPDSGSWSGEYHKIILKTDKSGIHLAYRRGYYATLEPTEKAADLELQVAACRDMLNSTSLLVAAKQLPADQAGKAKYFMEIDPSKLTFTAETDGTRQMAVKVGVCTFDKSGTPLQFMEQVINPKLTEKQYSTVKTNGYPHYVVLAPGAAVATVRLLVQDVSSGQLGSVTIPYTQMVASAATPATSNAAPAPTAQTTH